jgi:hypothetical protein
MSTSAKVAAEKKVDLPTFGLPTIPIRTIPPEDVKAVTRYETVACTKEVTLPRPSHQRNWRQHY